MSDDLVKRLRDRNSPVLDEDAHEAADRIEELERLDAQAATYVESVICLRTHFTGDPPYVGWEGLGLALEEALNERDAMRDRIEELEAAIRPFSRHVDLLDDTDDDDTIITGFDSVFLTAGDLRRARATYEGTPDERDVANAPENEWQTNG